MQSEDKLCVVVLFGGMSSEHKVSRVSAGTFVDNLDRARYEVLTVGITREGRWLCLNSEPPGAIQGYCESLTLPTGDGVYGVQAGHNPVLVALHMGIAKFTVDGETREVLVGDGIAEVTPTFVLLLVDSAERPEDIDRNRAEAARIRAEERLQHKQSMHEYYQSKIALDRAMQRLQTAAKYKR